MCGGRAGKAIWYQMTEGLECQAKKFRCRSISNGETPEIFEDNFIAGMMEEVRKIPASGQPIKSIPPPYLPGRGHSSVRLNLPMQC